MEIYTMKADGSDVRRLTNRVGPDGGPFFSWDGQRIAFRGRTLELGPELDDYRALLKEGLWRPTELELFVMDRDGGNLRQVTRLGGANFAPPGIPTASG
jgi:Tol biopolymer transport system component